MPPSFRTIDYALRPAKHTERRMLCDIFRRLTPFHTLSDYTYVGFGGIAFSDFILFHKSLGIPKMISMEESPLTEKRLNFNKPFNAVKVICKHSSKVLSSLKWKSPHILWLDYDDPLIAPMFGDMATVANHAESGTVLAFSFQCQQAPETETDPAVSSPMTAFESSFSKKRIPSGTTEEDLFSWRYGTLGEKMLLVEIDAILASRNARLKAQEKISFKKICTIQYQDNAKMHTAVGVFVSEEQKSLLDECNFEEIDFLTGGNHIKIEVPPLTLREIRSLESQLPLDAGKNLDHGVIPAKDANNFQKLYRYLPNFSVLES